MITRSTSQEAANCLKMGKSTIYKLAREGPPGPRTDAGMAIESEITLSDQERGKEWEYRVTAAVMACYTAGNRSSASYAGQSNYC